MTTDPLYVSEYLPRVNSISICIGLAISDIHKAIIAGNGEMILINDYLKIRLPEQTRTQQSNLIPLLVPQDKNVNIRLPCNFQNTRPRNQDIEFLTSIDNYKWTSRELSKCKGRLSCINCGNELVNLNEVGKINSMPSETWSELMDFWHCHKPAAGDNSISNRFNSFKPIKKDLIVGSYYIVLNTSEFNGFGELLCCGKCGLKLGELDNINNNERMFKWNLRLDNDEFKPYLFAYYVMIDGISSNAVRFHLIRNTKTNERLYIWCFNFGLKVGMNEGVMLEDSLKIFYQDEQDKIKETLKNEELHYELLEVDDLIYVDLKTSLQNINGNLPKTQREFNSIWKVSYLSKNL